MKSGPFASCTASRTAASCHSGMCSFVGDLHGLAPHRLAQGQREHRRGIGHVLAEDQHGVRLLDVVQRRGSAPGRRCKHVERSTTRSRVLWLGHPEIEAIGGRPARAARSWLRARRAASRCRSARVPDESQRGGALQPPMRRGRRAGRAAADERRADAAVAVDEVVAEAAAVAEEVAVDLAVEAVADAAQLCRSARRGSCCSRARNARRPTAPSAVPLAREVQLERLVGEDAGRADFDQVAAEFAFEDAVLVAAEVDVVVQRRRRRNRGRRRSPDRSARSGSTGCSGSSRG